MKVIIKLTLALLIILIFVLADNSQQDNKAFIAAMLVASFYLSYKFFTHYE